MQPRGSFITSVLGVIALSSAVVAAGQEHGKSTTAQPSSTSDRKVHVQGCVFPKRALTSPTPVIVPAGAVEDYVLTDLSVISASEGLTVPKDTVFQLDQVDQNQLRQYIGKSVGVVGRVDDKPGASQLHVISIRETMGTACPVVPAPKS